MVSFPIVHELSSINSSFGSFSLSPLSLKEEIQLETPLEVLEGTPYIGGAYPPTSLAMIYLSGGETDGATAHFGQGTATLHS